MNIKFFRHTMHSCWSFGPTSFDLSNKDLLIYDIMLGSPLIKAHASLVLIGGAVAFSFIVGMMSGIFPAKQASSLKPVDALRYE